jgi:hypothetical protein
MAQSCQEIRQSRLESPIPREGWRKNASGQGQDEPKRETLEDWYSFALRVVRPWNNLPSESREQQSVEAFKRMIRKYKMQEISLEWWNAGMEKDRWRPNREGGPSGWNDVHQGPRGNDLDETSSIPQVSKLTSSVGENMKILKIKRPKMRKNVEREQIKRDNKQNLFFFGGGIETNRKRE